MLPPQLLLYMAIAPEAKLTYDKAGPNGVAAFERGVAGLQATAFRGCAVFTSDPLCAARPAALWSALAALTRAARRSEVSDDADSVQLLTRNSQVGEFYILQPPQVKPNDAAFTCDVLLYDEESDRHVRITWLEALRASGAGELAKNMASTGATEVANGTDAAKNNKLSDWFAEAAKWAGYSAGWALVEIDSNGKISKGSTPKAQSGADLDQTVACNDWDTLNKDIRLVIARPFIEHTMHSVILTVAGRDTGATCANCCPRAAPPLCACR